MVKIIHKELSRGRAVVDECSKCNAANRGLQMATHAQAMNMGWAKERGEGRSGKAGEC